MRAVIDTNVLVSGLLSRGGKPSLIVDLVIAGEIDIFYNDEILAEYEDVLTRAKFESKIPLPNVARLIGVIQDIGTSMVVWSSNEPMIDEKDRVFYDVAKASGAYLVTGNAKHFPQEPFVVTPAEFLALGNG